MQIITVCEGMMERMQNEAWLDEINRIVSFHEISDSRYYSAEEHDFWQMIVSLIMTGYRVLGSRPSQEYRFC